MPESLRVSFHFFFLLLLFLVMLLLFLARALFGQRCWGRMTDTLYRLYLARGPWLCRAIGRPLIQTNGCKRRSAGENKLTTVSELATSKKNFLRSYSHFHFYPPGLPACYLPTGSDPLPAGSEALSAGSEAIPAGSEALPVGSEPLPALRFSQRASR